MLSSLKSRVKAAETRLHELKAWREVQIKKLDLTKKPLQESERQTEVLTTVLKDKEGEISSLRKKVLQAKEDGKTEFCNSNGFLYELGSCYVDDFNKCLH